MLIASYVLWYWICHFALLEIPNLKALAIDFEQKSISIIDKSVTLGLNFVCQNNSTALSIKKLIEGRTYIVGLGVGVVPWGQPSESEFFLKRIIEGLSNNSACDSLVLNCMFIKCVAHPLLNFAFSFSNKCCFSISQ